MEELSNDLKMLIASAPYSPLCKICTAFRERSDIYVAITRDIHIGERRQDIIDKYSPLLPDGVAPINRMNIASHKYHTDPKKLLRSIVVDPRKDLTEGRVLVKLLEETVGTKIDKERIMDGLNMARLQDMGDLEVMLVRNRAKWQKQMNKAERQEDSITMGELERLEGRFLSLVERRHTLWNDMHDILLKEMKDGRETVESKLRAEIYRMMIDNLNLHLISFMKEVSDILLHDEFAEHPERGVRIFQRLAKAMNTHLQPMIKDFAETGMVDAKYEDIPV